MKLIFAFFAALAILSSTYADTSVSTDTDVSTDTEDVKLKEKSNSSLGIDFRLRQEVFDNIPVAPDPPGVARNGYNNYFRIRTRIYGTLDLGEYLSFNTRLVNEFRHYNMGSKTYEIPDELIVDKLNLKIKDVFGESSYLVIGRQEIVGLGSGRLFLEGTAKDGSRTIYFDGISGHFKLTESLTLDTFATYTAAENKLAIGNEHRDITGYGSGFNGMDEASAGFFLTHNCPDVMKSTGYYIWKHDTSWHKADMTRMPNEDIHTIGVYLKPKFTQTLSGELEYAYQFSPSSDSDRCAMLGFAGLKYSPQVNNSPYISANFLYLSGDDPESSRREDWNPLFGRYPWISELYVYAYDPEGAGYWNNLLYGYLEAGVSFAEKHRIKGTVGIMGAEEKDGSGDGRRRGELITAQYDFPISFVDNLYASVLGEVFFPGDYYKNDTTAYFIRWELMWTF